jgi:serine/threonine protein kinase/WD40 repeat protein
MRGFQAQLRGVFCEAIGSKTPEARSEYLDRACLGQPGLRSRVEALLRAEQEVGGFLEDKSASVADPRTEVGPGGMIGPYKLLEEIGAGGFGLVFLAEQLHPVRRKVAIKVLKPGMDSRQVIARFEAERQALALMDHPNIARVLDAGQTASGLPHVVMELARGVPITDYCDQYGLGTRQRLELFATVCDAVQHAHQKGIIHRDLKPSNVLVTLHDGVPVVKVIDFGIAKAIGQALTDKTLHTAIEQMIGTPLYMSPEQAQMGGLDVDTRTDVYSLGALLYELLTGTTPHAQERLRNAGYDEMRRIIREEEPPRPSVRLSTLTQRTPTRSPRQSDPQRLSRLIRGDLDWIAMKALEKDRTRRYATASAFAADVQHYLHDEPVAACPPSAWYLFRKFARRRRVALSIAAVVTAALALAAGSLGWVARDRAARNAIVAERDAAIKSRERAEEAEARARKAERENEIRSHLGQAAALRLSREPARRERALAQIRAAVALAPSASLHQELRNEAISCLAIALDLSPGKVWPGFPPGSYRFDLDGKLERYARSDHEGNVSVRRVADDVEISRIKGTGREIDLRFSFDGEFLVIGNRLSSTKVWKVADDPPSLVFERDFGPRAVHDSQPLVAIGRKNHSFEVLDLNTRNARVYETGMPVKSLAWRPGANQIAVLHATGVKVLSLDTKQWVANLPINPRRWYPNLSWHPDGRSLAMTCDDKTIKLWNVDEGEKSKLVTLERTVDIGSAMAFSHRGNLLATTAWDGILRLWDPRTGTQSKTLDWRSSEVPRFSPDDRRIAASTKENSLQLWELTVGEECRALVRGPDGGRSYHSDAVATKGRLLAVGSPDGVELWDLKTASFLYHLPIGATYGVAFDHSVSEVLLTNGPAGVYRWPAAAEPDSARVRIGPPRKLALPGTMYEIAVSHDGQFVAQAAGPAGARVLWQETDEVIPLAPHPDTRTVAVSPDGRWVATGTHTGFGARIWESHTGNLVRELMPNASCGVVGFSADGRFLATQCLFPLLWNVGPWGKSDAPQGTQCAFAPDGKMLAVETGDGVVRLLDLSSGSEFARLENPRHEKAGRIFFSQDGALLVTVGGESDPIHVWDLRRTRRTLAEMGLDWERPRYPPESPAWSHGPLQLQVDLGPFSPQHR